MRNQLNDSHLKKVACECRKIAKLEKAGITEKELRRQLYVLGTYVFRNYHGAGIPVDIKHPGLTAPKKVWSDRLSDFISELEIDKLEALSVEEDKIALAA